MKLLMRFLSSTLQGGILVVLPLLLFYLAFSELLEVTILLAHPIVEFLPQGWIDFEKAQAPILLATALIVAVSFLSGLILRSHRLTSLFRSLEAKTLAKLPIYKAVKGLGRGLISSRDEGFKGAVLTHSDGSKQLVYIVEPGTDGWSTVMIPLAPSGFSGPIQLIQSSRLQLIEASVGDISATLAHFGHGSGELIRSADLAPTKAG